MGKEMIEKMAKDAEGCRKRNRCRDGEENGPWLVNGMGE